MRIVFATNNAHKLSEIRQILGNQYEVLSLSDIGCHAHVTQLVDVALHFVAIALVFALAALVVDDQQAAVGTAHNAVGTQVLDSVLGLFRGCGDRTLAIHFVGGVKPYSDTALRVHDGAAHVFIDIGQTARVIVIVGDDAVFDAVVDGGIHVVAVRNAAHQAVEPQTRIDV